MTFTPRVAESVIPMVLVTRSNGTSPRVLHTDLESRVLHSYSFPFHVTTFRPPRFSSACALRGAAGHGRKSPSRRVGGALLGPSRRLASDGDTDRIGSDGPDRSPGVAGRRRTAVGLSAWIITSEFPHNTGAGDRLCRR